MALTFANAPLVELIAELRWSDGPAFPIAQKGQGGIRIQFGGGDESLFMRFGGELYKRGFQASERLIPSGVPLVGTQPVYRFRRVEEAGASPVMYQIGPGIFSVNAVPPYKTWQEFRPNIVEGLNALLTARAEDLKEPFTGLTLRYIDAFRPPLTQGLDIGEFVGQVLGINLGVPTALSKYLAKGQCIKPVIQLSIPMEGLMLGFTAAEGTVNGEAAFIVDTNVSSTVPIQSEHAQIMSVFERAHDVIHDVFVSLTAGIADQMGPEGA